MGAGRALFDPADVQCGRGDVLDQSEIDARQFELICPLCCDNQVLGGMM